MHLHIYPQIILKDLKIFVTKNIRYLICKEKNMCVYIYAWHMHKCKIYVYLCVCTLYKRT